MNIKKTIKDWMLPIAMVTGASVYLLYHALPEPVHRIGPFLEGTVDVVQPLLLFAMLFLTFCAIEPEELKPHRWHWWLLLIQGGIFTALGLFTTWMLHVFPDVLGENLVLLESAMLCLICPTATAAAVVTRKLGGDVPGLTTYIVLVNLMVAVIVPLIVPLVHPDVGLGFWKSFSLIMSKVFPLLIAPCLCAWLVRYMAPKLHRKILLYPDLPFYIWSVALTLAIAVTARSLTHTTLSAGLLLMMALISLASCIFQFAMGRYIGSRYNPRRPLDNVELVARGRYVRTVTAGQALGQKNTIFSIWMAYTFMTPETVIVGGLYSIWHNLYNSWQLYRKGK